MLQSLKNWLSDGNMTNGGSGNNIAYLRYMVNKEIRSDVATFLQTRYKTVANNVVSDITSILKGYMNGETKFSWNTLKNQSSCTSCSYWTFCADHVHIAQIIRQIGEDSRVSYSPQESGTTFFRARETLYQYGYTSDYSEDYNFNSVKTSLSNGRPLFMRGYLPHDEGGHTWVVDGCREVRYTYYSYSKPHGSPNSAWILEGINTETSRLNHINWGWKGDSNGYFADGCFNTRHGAYDTGCSHYANFDFTYDFRILPNIRRQ